MNRSIALASISLLGLLWSGGAFAEEFVRSQSAPARLNERMPETTILERPEGGARTGESGYEKLPPPQGSPDSSRASNPIQTQGEISNPQQAPGSGAGPSRPKTLTRTDAVKSGLSDLASKPVTTDRPSGGNPSTSQYDKLPARPEDNYDLAPVSPRRPENARAATTNQYDKLPAQSQYGSAPPERTNATSSSNQYDKLPPQSPYGSGPPERTIATPYGNGPPERTNTTQYGSAPPERTNATSSSNQYDKLPAQSQYGSGPPERTNATSSSNQYDKLPPQSPYGSGPPERTNATSSSNQYDKLPAQSQYSNAPKPLNRP